MKDGSSGTMQVRWRAACLAALLFAAAPAAAQTFSVKVQVEVVHDAAAKPAVDASNVVLWLVPLDDPPAAVAATRAAPLPRLEQKHKAFVPHVVVVQVGSLVQFPNRDPYFHNVFSLFNGKRFDLGLYEAGSTRSVRFDRAGISYLFCNIHPEMSAVVVAVPTPFFAISGPDGKAIFSDVPAGRYRLHVWYERSTPEDLQHLGHVVTVSEKSLEIRTVRVPENLGLSLTHKNKYGQDYVPPQPSSPGYLQPPPQR